MTNKSYIEEFWSDKIDDIITYFHNGSGYRIIVYREKIGETQRIVAEVSYKWSVFSLGIISSGWETDHVVGSCIEDLPKIIEGVRDKVTRRFFLKTIRELPMHEFKIKDFLTNNGKGDRIDWCKVRKYEEKYYGGGM